MTVNDQGVATDPNPPSTSGTIREISTPLLKGPEDTLHDTAGNNITYHARMVMGGMSLSDPVLSTGSPMITDVAEHRGSQLPSSSPETGFAAQPAGGAARPENLVANLARRSSDATTVSEPGNDTQPSRENGKWVHKHACKYAGCGKTFTTRYCIFMRDPTSRILRSNWSGIYSAHLSRHTKLHMGIKPHHCPLPDCGKGFARRDNMMVMLANLQFAESTTRLVLTLSPFRFTTVHMLVSWDSWLTLVETPYRTHELVPPLTIVRRSPTVEAPRARTATNRICGTTIILLRTHLRHTITMNALTVIHLTMPNTGTGRTGFTNTLPRLPSISKVICRLRDLPHKYTEAGITFITVHLLQPENVEVPHLLPRLFLLPQRRPMAILLVQVLRPSRAWSKSLLTVIRTKCFPLELLADLQLLSLLCAKRATTIDMSIRTTKRDRDHKSIKRN